jgi:hypothetical protein
MYIVTSEGLRATDGESFLHNDHGNTCLGISTLIFRLKHHENITRKWESIQDFCRLLNRRPRGSEGDVEELGLPSNNHASFTGKLEVSSNSAGVDLANELARSIPHPNTIAGASVDTALGVGMNTVRNESGNIGKSLAVFEGAVFSDIKRVNGSGRREITAIEAKRNTSVGYVSLVAIGRDGNAVGESEVVGDDSRGSSLEVVAVDLVSETGDGAEILQETIEGICEVQITIFRVDHKVIQGVELATEVVIKKS